MRKSADMPYHMGLKVKIYPSDAQKHLIAVNDGARRAVYNHLVACGNERYRISRYAAFSQAYRERADYLLSVSGTAAGIKNALPYLYGPEVDDQAVTNAILNYRAAWKNQKEQHRGVPVFKKKSYEQSYQTNAHYYKDRSGREISNVRFEDRSHVTLPKLGRIRIGASPKIMSALLSRTADTRIATVTIERDSVGEYWASFALASEEPFHSALPKTGSMHGIDLNLVELTNDSDGGFFENRRFYVSSQKKLAKAQRRMSRMAGHAKADGRELHSSQNYQTQRRRVAYINRKTARQREDYLHVISKHEVENQDFIAAEDLKAGNLKKT